MERIVRNQEKSLISQEKKLEEIEEENKKRGEELQAQDKQVEGWNRASLQEPFVQSTVATWPLSPGILSTARLESSSIPTRRLGIPAVQPAHRTRDLEKEETLEKTSKGLKDPLLSRLCCQKGQEELQGDPKEAHRHHHLLRSWNSRGNPARLKEDWRKLQEEPKRTHSPLHLCKK